MTEPVAVKRALWPFVSKIRRRKRSKHSVFVAVAAALAWRTNLASKGNLATEAVTPWLRLRNRSSHDFTIFMLDVYQIYQLLSTGLLSGHLVLSFDMA
jgi:hypothetical protein